MKKIRSLRFIIVGALLFAILFSSGVGYLVVSSQASASAQQSQGSATLVQAFKDVSAAESAGGNVTSLANQLNQAVMLSDNASQIAQSNPTLSQKLYSQANAIASQVISESSSVSQQGAINTRNSEILFLAEMSGLGVIAVVIYLFTPKIFWNFWERARRNWRVRKTRAATDAQVIGALLVVVLLVGLSFSYSYFWSNRVTQPYSEIAILGPNQTLSGYPQSVHVGQNFSLNLYVGNQEGRVMYYQVYEKIGNTSNVVNQTTYLTSKPIASYGFVLTNNETSIRPLSLSLNVTGTPLKIVFELWTYSIPNQAFVYSGQWTQLVMNVTS